MSHQGTGDPRAQFLSFDTTGKSKIQGIFQDVLCLPLSQHCGTVSLMSHQSHAMRISWINDCCIVCPLDRKNERCFVVRSSQDGKYFLLASYLPPSPLELWQSLILQAPIQCNLAVSFPCLFAVPAVGKEELEENIVLIKDIAPGYGEGFIEACLVACKGNAQQAANMLLEKKFPEPLKSMDNQMARSAR